MADAPGAGTAACIGSRYALATKMAEEIFGCNGGKEVLCGGGAVSAVVSARTDNGDECVAAAAAAHGAAFGHRAGNLLPINLPVGCGPPELARMAIGGGGCLPAGGA